MTLLKIALVKNKISRLAIWIANNYPPIGKQVEMEPHFEERINLLLTAYFTRNKFTNLNYFEQQWPDIKLFFNQQSLHMWL